VYIAVKFMPKASEVANAAIVLEQPVAMSKRVTVVSRDISSRRRSNVRHKKPRRQVFGNAAQVGVIPCRTRVTIHTWCWAARPIPTNTKAIGVHFKGGLFGMP
jgi:hypothetical protein